MRLYSIFSLPDHSRVRWISTGHDDLSFYALSFLLFAGVFASTFPLSGALSIITRFSGFMSRNNCNTMPDSPGFIYATDRLLQIMRHQWPVALFFLQATGAFFRNISRIIQKLVYFIGKLNKIKKPVFIIRQIVQIKNHIIENSLWLLWQFYK